MGWAKDVADLIVRNGHFRLYINDAIRMREFDEIEQRLVTSEQQLAASQAALRASTELLVKFKPLPWNPGNRELIKNQIAANEAALKGVENVTD